jgi:putative acyl-CoA dehydrogenase
MGYLMGQAESGHGCPLTMTFAAVPVLRGHAEVAAEWLPRLLASVYDPRAVPAAQKLGALCGMGMTEKQGGSDVRANTTRARPLGTRTGAGADYELTGHKWFFSAPMCDVFLVLAQAERGLSCFLVPRWKPDGTRNVLRIQRLKDKLGNRSNASSEVEFEGTWACMLGEEGRGVRTIIEMVGHTRLDCVVGSAALMRQAVAQATHHAAHRSAFGRRLAGHPLMQNVLADLALECEAATVLALRLARAYDEAQTPGPARAFARIATAIAKYWVCKRTPPMVGEALECLGGAGYVEESVLPRLYREAPLNSIWEGSGNVMCLDVMRAMMKEPDTVPLVQQELARGLGAHLRLDAFLRDLARDAATPPEEGAARRVVERLAVGMQAVLLVQHAPSAVADAFIRSRVGSEHGLAYGTLPQGVDCADIVARATPQR